MIHIVDHTLTTSPTVRSRAICGTALTETLDYDPVRRSAAQTGHSEPVLMCIECATIAAEAVAHLARIRWLQDVGAIRADTLRVNPTPNVGLLRD